MIDIGARLKAARQRSGLSLRALGDRTGFSASFLSQVELGQSSPSLSSLSRIAQALGVTLGSLLTQESNGAEGIVRRRDAVLKSEWSRAAVRPLLPPGVDKRMAAVLVTLEPGGKSGASPVAMPGYEFVYGIHGHLELTLDGQSHEFGEGDSVFYDTSRRIQWKNIGEKNAEILFVSLQND